jgi:hypothetical protein
MKTFDVSVNVLNTNVVWKQRNTLESSHISLHQHSPHTNQQLSQALNPQSTHTLTQQANQQAHQIANQQPTLTTPTGTDIVCTWHRPAHLKLEMIFLTLPFFVLMSLVVTFQHNTNVHILSTLIGSSLVLTTPAVFVVWHNRRWRVEKQNYVHMFLLHGAGVLAILQSSYVAVVFIVFCAVFAHVLQQSTTQKLNIRNTGICGIMLVLNGVAIILLQQQTAESSWHFHILCSIIAISSISVYIVYTFVEYAPTRV